MARQPWTWLRRLAVVALVVAHGALPAVAASRAEAKPGWTGRVTHVSDGDTLWVRPPEGGRARPVRLDGIDAPELCQQHGVAARRALQQRVLHRSVRVSSRAKDGYQRSLAQVRLGREDMGRWMVLQGHAWSHRWRGRSGAYAAEEARARQARRGLFAEARPELPRDFRQRHGACR